MSERRYLDRFAIEYTGKRGACGTVPGAVATGRHRRRLLLGGGSIDGKRIVSEAGFQQMQTKLTRVYEEPYGLGLWVFNPKDTYGTQLYGHPGGVDGFNADFAFAPARKLGFAILTNSSDAGATLYDATAKIVFGHLLLQP